VPLGWETLGCRPAAGRPPRAAKVEDTATTEK
jgi:hypothetical protein